MIKTKNQVNEPFEVIVNGERMVIVAKKAGNSIDSPCDFCDLRDVAKTLKGGATPRNCHGVVPSCFANQREDNTSVIYKRIK